MKRNSVGRIALCGMLLAVMLVLGFVESRIPISSSVPGIRLGLSNSVLLFAVYMLDIPAAFVLMVLKVVLSGLLFSGINAMMYAFAGGLVSLVLMCVLSRIRWMHPIVVSMVGGAAHNAGQTLLAMWITRTDLTVYLAWLLLIGLGCGFLTGICARAVMQYLKKNPFGKSAAKM